jgi:hypothetical protein
MQTMGKIILESIPTPAIFIKKIKAITGMNPKASCGVLYPPLCGIVSNSIWLLENSAKKHQCAYSDL